MFVIALLKHETWQSHFNKLVKVLFGRNSFRGQNSSATHIILDSVCLAPQRLLLQTLAMHLSFMNPLQQSCSEKVPILSLLSSLRCWVYGGQRWRNGRKKQIKKGWPINSLLINLNDPPKQRQELLRISDHILGQSMKQSNHRNVAERAHASRGTNSSNFRGMTNIKDKCK